MKKLSLLAVTAMLVAFASGTSAAVVYDLSSDHCTDGCGPAGTIFGNVTLTQTGANVDVLVQLNSGFGFAKTGAVDNQTFLFNGTGVVLADISVDAHVPVLVATNGPYTASAIGTFAFGIGCPSCGGGLSSTFSNAFTFHVANATIADLTGGSGSPFAADIGNLTTGRTGPIDASLHSPVPEPISLSLVGGGLLALGLFRKRFVA